VSSGMNERLGHHPNRAERMNRRGTLVNGGKKG